MKYYWHKIDGLVYIAFIIGMCCLANYIEHLQLMTLTRHTSTLNQFVCLIKAIRVLQGSVDNYYGNGLQVVLRADEYQQGKRMFYTIE